MDEFGLTNSTPVDPGTLHASSQVETRYMTVAEAAEALGVSKMTVYRMVHKGDLRANKVGRRYRVFVPSVARMSEPSYQPQD